MRNKEWTNEELGYLVKNYDKKKPAEIAEYLGRSLDAVYQKAKEYKIENRSRRRTKYVKRLISFTPLQDNYLSHFTNKSKVVRKALAIYIANEKSKQKYDTKRKNN